MWIKKGWTLRTEYDKETSHRERTGVQSESDREFMKNEGSDSHLTVEEEIE